MSQRTILYNALSLDVSKLRYTFVVRNGGIMRVLTAKEAEEKFGITSEQIDKWEEDISKGIFHGEPGEIVIGRPLMFGEEMKQVGFKEPLRKIEAIDKRAKQLGMKRSDYLRHLVDEDLRAAGMA